MLKRHNKEKRLIKCRTLKRLKDKYAEKIQQDATFNRFETLTKKNVELLNEKAELENRLAELENHDFDTTQKKIDNMEKDIIIQQQKQRLSNLEEIIQQSELIIEELRRQHKEPEYKEIEVFINQKDEDVANKVVELVTKKGVDDKPKKKKVVKKKVATNQKVVNRWK